MWAVKPITVLTGDTTFKPSMTIKKKMIAKHLGKVPSLVIAGEWTSLWNPTHRNLHYRTAVNRKLNKSGTLTKNPCLQQSVLKNIQTKKQKNSPLPLVLSILEVWFFWPFLRICKDVTGDKWVSSSKMVTLLYIITTIIRSNKGNSSGLQPMVFWQWFYHKTSWLCTKPQEI